MKKELINEFLTKTGTDPKLIDLLMTDASLPEDFELSNSIAAHQNSQMEVWKAKHGGALIGDAQTKAKDAATIAAYNSAKQKLKKAFGLDANVKEIDYKDLVGLAVEKMQASANAGDDELRQELTNFKEKFTAEVDAKLKAQTALSEFQEASKNEMEAFKNGYLTDQMLQKHISSIEWASTGDKKIFEQESLTNWLKSNYDMSPDKKFTKKYGTPEIKPNGAGTYNDITELINNRVDALGLRSVSNGGKQTGTTVKIAGQEIAVGKDGKEIDYSRVAEKAKILGMTESEN